MYQVLYRKWRPKTFDDVVGQEHISETLKRQISSGRLSHAYLFVGTRGTGKTTCAKILAKAINCEHPENGSPCNKCHSCMNIENGSNMDVVEIDAASNNGVDNVRALREEAVLSPLDVKKRVYIIDEVHMLSVPAFNALLKILEEPPEHLIFILATTEIHKVPATILSRCQRFTFKRILPEIIAARLHYIARQENITLTNDASNLLVRLADGSLRDALSLLDQCAWDDTVDYDRVLTAIGLAGSNEISDILSAVAKNDTAAALDLLNKLYNSGKVMSSVLEELTNLTRDVLITLLMPKGGTGLLSGGFDYTVLQLYAKHFTPEQLLTVMDILRETTQNLAKSSGGKLDVELCLMRLCDSRLNTDVTSLLSRVAQLEERLSSDIDIIPAVKAPPAQPEKPAVNHFPVPETAPVPAIMPEAEIAAPVTAAEVPSQALSGEIWSKILAHAKPKIEESRFSFLNDQLHSTASIDENTLTVKAKNPFAALRIDVPPVTAALKESAAAILNKVMMVRIVMDDGSASGGGEKLDALSRFSNIKFE